MTTHVLVADDDLDMRDAVASFLKADGMSVQVARTGDEVLSKLADGNVDLLVTDVSMPGLSGLDVAVMIRTAGKPLPIVVITARREPWVAESVHRLQCADLLHKPFSRDELLRRAHDLLDRQHAHTTEGELEGEEQVFPPALVPILRERVDADCLAGMSDADVIELLSVVFFAGLAKEEGARHHVRVVFVGEADARARSAVEGAPRPMVRWSTLRFERARVFSASELAKLATVTMGPRSFIEVRLREGKLVIMGIAREGVNLEGDLALKIVVESAGELSLRVGRHHLLDYANGRVQSHGSRLVLTRGPVRAALERAALEAGLPPTASEHYLAIVRQLVAKLSAHGRGGILIIGAAARAKAGPGYRTHPDVSLAAILLRMLHVQSHAERAAPTEREQDRLLLGALQAEKQETIAEFGAVTALDGATLLDPALSLTGFGMVLSVHDEGVTVVDAENTEATVVKPFDLGSRGTRHRAAAVYAWTHPGIVVFIASQDGDVGCLLRAPDAGAVNLWRFRATDLLRA